MGREALIVVALWLGIVGYGVLYTGTRKLAGDSTCTLGKAFAGQCGSAPADSSGQGGATPGRTIAQRRQELRNRQWDHLSRQPLVPNRPSSVPRPA